MGRSNAKVGYDVGFDRPMRSTGTDSRRVPPADQRLRRIPDDRVPAGVLAGEGGYDVTYISNVDTHADAKGLLRAKAFLSVGHDEYWTERMFDNVTRRATPASTSPSSRAMRFQAWWSCCRAPTADPTG